MESIDLLLSEGARVNQFDDLSYTPLHYAAVGGHTSVVDRLIQAGAEVNANLEERIGDTALKEAAGTCSLEMARILVDAGADPTITGWMGLTALDCSVERADEEGKAVHHLLLEVAKRVHPEWPRLGEFL
jgi:ankyrin repeat protein